VCSRPPHTPSVWEPAWTISGTVLGTAGFPQLKASRILRVLFTAIFVIPHKSSRFNDLLDRVIWLLLASNGPLWRVTGTNCGDIFAGDRRRHGRVVVCSMALRRLPIFAGPTP
jgi:hypothetical protein